GLARLQRHAMDDDAGILEESNGAVAKISSSLRRPPGHEHHVACGETLVDQAGQHDLIIRPDSELDGNAADLLDRGGEDRGIRVVDGAWPDRLVRVHDYVARGTVFGARLQVACA